MKDHQRQTLVRFSAMAAFASVAAGALFAPLLTKTKDKQPPLPPKPVGNTQKATPPFAAAAQKKTTTVTAPGSSFLWTVTETKAPDFFAPNATLSLITPQANPLLNIDVKLGPTPAELAAQKAFAEHKIRAQKILDVQEAKTQALRDRLNDGFIAYTNAALAQGIGRNTPAEKGPDNASAAFVYQASQLAFSGLTTAAPEKPVKKKKDAGPVFDGTSAAQLTGSSAHQINAVAGAVKTKRLSGNEVTIENLKPGMIIGIEEKKSGHIDKTAIVYLDEEKGRLIVAQGIAGAGVKIMTARDFLTAAAERGDILQAADMVPYVAAKSAAPKTKFKYDTSPDALAGIGADEGAFLRATISMGIETYTKDAVKRGVTYSFGDDTGATSIDCSGFVRKCVISAQGNVTGGSVTGDEFPRVSVDQFKAIEAVTGAVLEGDKITVKNLREGRVIAMDHGPSFKDGEQWDAGREHGIDHIGIVYRDSSTRQLMLAESSGGVGVHATRLPDFLEKKKDRGAKLFGVDLVAYAAKQGWKPAEKQIIVQAAKTKKPVAAKAAKHKPS